MIELNLKAYIGTGVGTITIPNASPYINDIDVQVSSITGSGTANMVDYLTQVNPINSNDVDIVLSAHDCSNFSSQGESLGVDVRILFTTCGGLDISLDTPETICYVDTFGAINYPNIDKAEKAIPSQA